MDKNEHVYCTNCIHFDDNLECLNNDYHLEKEHCKNCKCNGCECGDLEDSAAFEFRPKYVAMWEEITR